MRGNGQRFDSKSTRLTADSTRGTQLPERLAQRMLSRQASADDHRRQCEPRPPGSHPNIIGGIGGPV